MVIATENTTAPNFGSFLAGKSCISGKSREVKYNNLARWWNSSLKCLIGCLQQFAPPKNSPEDFLTSSQEPFFCSGFFFGEFVNALRLDRQVFFCGRDCQKEAWIAAKRKVKAKTASWFGDSWDASLSFALTLVKQVGDSAKDEKQEIFIFEGLDYKA